MPQLRSEDEHEDKYGDVGAGPEESWGIAVTGMDGRVRATAFEIHEQREGLWAVKIRPQGLQEFWLRHPERHFETLGGAHRAILCYLEDPQQ